MKDKLSIEDVLERTVEKESGSVSNVNSQVQTEAVQALVALGYGNTESLKAVKKVGASDEMSVEEILKQALKYIM